MLELQERPAGRGASGARKAVVPDHTGTAFLFCAESAELL
jgi:hypothetical protein